MLREGYLSPMRIALTRAVVVAGLLAAIGGCTPEQDCSSGCTVAALATFNLSCNPNDLTGVVASGPCSIPDAGLAWYTGVGSEQSVGVSSKGPGVCHVE
jgi:hypothetical protein